MNKTQLRLFSNMLLRIAGQLLITSSRNKRDKELIEFIRWKFEDNFNWAKKALLKIGRQQTSSELSSGEAHFNNSVGFSSFDARFLTSLYRTLFVESSEEFKNCHERFGGNLSRKQQDALVKVMKKYAGQIYDNHTDKRKLEKIFEEQKERFYEKTGYGQKDRTNDHND